MKTEYKRLKKTTFEFSIDMLMICKSLSEDVAWKYPVKQLAKYSMQSGAKVARCAAGFDSPFFVKDFAMGCRRAENIPFWLKMVYEAGYINQATYLEFNIRVEKMNGEMQQYLKKIRLKKAILRMDKLEIVNKEKLNYN